MHETTLTFRTRAVCGVLGLGVALCCWQVLVSSGYVNSLLAPSPASVLSELAELLCTWSTWGDAAATVATWVAAVVLGSLLGGFLGLMFGLNRYVWAGAEPIVDFGRALPSVVLIPIVSLTLGVGSLSRLAAATLVVLLLMMASAAFAVVNTRLAYSRLASAWRASWFQRIYFFYLPSTLTQMAVALRAAIPLALIVTVAADMLIATDRGIGTLLMDSIAVFNMSKFYATTLIIGTMGFLGSLVVNAIDRKVIHWGSA